MLGEGTLAIAGNLDWTTESTMLGTGKTVLKSGASGSVTTGGGLARLKERTFVNEGNLSINKGLMRLSEGATFENKGTLTVNLEEGKNPLGSEESKVQPVLINTGTLQKTEGEGSSHVKVNIENFGAINAETGTLEFDRPGQSVLLGAGTTFKGNVLLSEVTATAATSFYSPGGRFTIERTELILPKGITATFNHLTVKYGNEILGEGTLAIATNLEWTTESTMAGTGMTVIEPGATGSITTGGGWARVKERTFVNEGDLSVNSGLLQLSEGAFLDNTGTLTTNQEAPSNAISTGSGEAPILANFGTMQKTAGTGHSRIAVDVFNEGTIDASTGTLNFYCCEKAVILASGSVLKGSINFESDAVIAESFTSSASTVTIDHALLDIPEGSTVTLDKFKMRFESLLAGDGMLNVSGEFHWDLESVMTGTGTTKLLGGSVNTVDVGATTATVDRSLINEGTLTMTQQSRLKIEKGERLQNRGTFRLEPGT